MKYQRPALRPLNEAFSAYCVCASGAQATRPLTCLTGISAAGATCGQGVHPGFSCSSGTLPGNKCASGSGDSEW
jgi:hypothetical protein